MERPLLTAPELAARYKVKLPTVRAWVHRTKIPVVRLGRLVRFDADVVDAWVRRGGATLAAKRPQPPADTR